MSVKLYYTLASPPSRASIFTLEALKISYELINIDVFEGEQLTPSFLKKNPLHTVPTLQDGEFYLSDSHAINAYLVNKFSEGNNILYPKDFRKRAIIDERLHFDSGVLFPNIKRVTRAIKTNQLTTITSEIQGNFEEAYSLVEKLISENHYLFISGYRPTIADFSFVTSLTTLNTLVPINEKLFPLVRKYLMLCSLTILKYKEINENGIKEYINALEDSGFIFPNRISKH